MHQGRTVLAQLMDFVPDRVLRRSGQRHLAPRQTRGFSLWDQWLCLAFAQLTGRESLRDIETCLRSRPKLLHHLGLRARVARSTLAEANERRPWLIWAELGRALMARARQLCAHEPLSVDLKGVCYALDTTTLTLCLNLFPWAQFRTHTGAVRLHTLLDLHGSIPAFALVSSGLLHEVHVWAQLRPEPGACYIVDRGFWDLRRLHELEQARAWFIIRARKNLAHKRCASRPCERASGVRCDQTIRMRNPQPASRYPGQLRRISYWDAASGKRLVFLTNNFHWPARVVCDLYRQRWRVELFFKWIKQHLRLKRFYGTSPNAVQTQIWVALSVYCLVAIVRKELKLPASLYTCLQVLSVNIFEKIAIAELFEPEKQDLHPETETQQLNLFDL